MAGRGDWLCVCLRVVSASAESQKVAKRIHKVQKSLEDESLSDKERRKLQQELEKLRADEEYIEVRCLSSECDAGSWSWRIAVHELSGVSGAGCAEIPGRSQVHCPVSARRPEPGADRAHAQRGAPVDRTVQDQAHRDWYACPLSMRNGVSEEKERERECVCVRVHVRVCECAGVGASARVNADTGVVAQPNRWIRSWRPT